MNQQLPLADIHTPTAISLWPIAYGWWILAALLILTVILAVKIINKRRNKRIQRHYALDALNAINLQDFSAGQQINEVLKRAAMVYYSREQVASLTGKKWQIFLLHTLGKKRHELRFDSSWLDFGYSATVDPNQVIGYHEFAKKWLTTALPGNGEMPDFDQALAQLDITDRSL